MNNLFYFPIFRCMQGFAACLLAVCLFACAADGPKTPMRPTEEYQFPLSDSMIVELEDLYRQSVRTHDYPAMEKIVGLIVRHYNNMNNHKPAFLLLNDYLNNVTASGDSALIPAALYYIGVVYFNCGLPNYSIEYFLKINDYPMEDRRRARVYYAMGENARTLIMNNAIDPMEYYRKSEAIARSQNDSAMISYTLFGQSQVLFDSMGAYKVANWSDGMRDSLARSTKLLEEAFACNSQTNDPVFIAALSLNYAAMGMYEKALSYREYIESFRSIPKQTSFTFNCLAAIGHYMKDYDEVIRLGREAFVKAEENNRNFDMHNAADILAHAYKAKGDYKNALLNLEIVRKIDDELKKNEGEMEVLALQVKYDLKVKEQLIANQRLKLLWSLIASGIAAVGLIIVVYFYRNKQIAWSNLVKQIEEQDLALAELEQVREENQKLSTLLVRENVPSENPDELFLRVNRLIKEYRLFTDTELSRKSVARKTGINERALFDCIKKNMGVGFSEYITSLRLAFARELLTQADQKLTLEGIARDAGFGSRTTFYRVFRSYYGISPDEFRKLTKGTGEK